MKKRINALFALACALVTPVKLMNGWIAAFVATLILLSVMMPGKGIGGVTTNGGINREIWESHIEENLFPSNEFIASMTDESEYVNYLTVHNPQAGAVPNVVKNRSKGGAPVNTNLRTDTVLDWDIDEYTSDPFLITNAEEVQLSYNKMESVLFEMQQELRKIVANNMLVEVAPTGTAVLTDGVTVNANVLRSSGITNNDPGNIVSSLAYTTSATGNRLNFTLYDIRRAKKMLDKLDVSDEGRAMVMSPDAADQIISDLIVTKFRQDAMNVFDTKTGRIDMLLGFKIYIRSQVVQYTNDATPVVKAAGAAGAATDNDAILFWGKSYVSYAMGDVHVYETPNSAVYYGDVYSTLIRMGATKRRATEIGVGAIVQAAAA